MDQYIGLDFETYAEVDLTKHGLDRYISCPHFQPLIAAIAAENGVVDLFDFVEDYTEERLRLIERIGGNLIVAHNAGFEQAVLAHMGISIPSSQFVDSAVLARAGGAAGKLEAAAPQLLGVDKLASGWELIKLFSIPGKYQEVNISGAFDPQIRVDYIDEWSEFARYCAIDAQLSIKLAGLMLPHISDRELTNNAVTMDMNNTGWRVDLDMVREMQRRYLYNVDATVKQFRDTCIEPDLNLNSHTQLQEWCAKRGVKATSFDEAHVERLLKSLRKKVATMPAGDKRANYEEVKLLLETKQVMGGSSLKKLQTIIDTTGTDGRLHDQYLHIGAGATFRTTGRGVQMQNLKRLNGQGDDMVELFDESNEWDNSKLASNLRQVFTATEPDGFLIVGDFSSVESRGLAWQAGEKWKLDAYFAGKDLYKVQAGKIFGKHEAHVTKSERQVGKVGELACGYGAGADAVRDFAAKMGVELSDVESAKLVRDWRGANPEIVDYWRRLDEALHDALLLRTQSIVSIPHGYVRVIPVAAPQSLVQQTKDVDLLSLRIELVLEGGDVVVARVIHGAHIKGRNILYWKPSERKTGDLWVDTWTNPKTKRQQPFTVYGGKLSGLLTQSLCREVFFDSLRKVHEWAAVHSNVELVGQFHDEIVLDWEPGAFSLADAKFMLDRAMSSSKLPEFPLEAVVKHDYRYTK